MNAEYDEISVYSFGVVSMKETRDIDFIRLNTLFITIRKES